MKNSFLKRKTHRSPKDFHEYLNLLEDLITIIQKEEISPFMDQAHELSPDPKDVVYLALALALDSHIWSNDKQLKNSQKQIMVYSTSDLVELLPLLK
ncbi:MAG: putative nucleotide-binding protein, containing PIN domain [Promethearchaeota archaeon]|nr:MAG: putative nucleotide-binding protein, containing PIN domain [Candidatus Lokiarchaeota archaeon]